MTAEEFIQARTRLGLSANDVAASYHLTPRMVAAIEAGTLPPPREVAQHLRWQAAYVERLEMLEQAGLPACADADALARALPDPDDRGYPAALEGLEAHGRACPVCTARVEWVREHAPPIPPPPEPDVPRAMRWAWQQMNRLPPAIRPSGGEARMGVHLSAAIALVVMVVYLLFRVITT